MLALESQDNTTSSSALDNVNSESVLVLNNQEVAQAPGNSQPAPASTNPEVVAITDTTNSLTGTDGSIESVSPLNHPPVFSENSNLPVTPPLSSTEDINNPNRAEILSGLIVNQLSIIDRSEKKTNTKTIEKLVYSPEFLNHKYDKEIAKFTSIENIINFLRNQVPEVKASKDLQDVLTSLNKNFMEYKNVYDQLIAGLKNIGFIENEINQISEKFDTYYRQISSKINDSQTISPDFFIYLASEDPKYFDLAFQYNSLDVIAKKNQQFANLTEEAEKHTLADVISQHIMTDISKIDRHGLRLNIGDDILSSPIYKCVRTKVGNYIFNPQPNQTLGELQNAILTDDTDRYLDDLNSHYEKIDASGNAPNLKEELKGIIKNIYEKQFWSITPEERNRLSQMAPEQYISFNKISANDVSMELKNKAFADQNNERGVYSSGDFRIINENGSIYSVKADNNVLSLSASTITTPQLITTKTLLWEKVQSHDNNALYRLNPALFRNLNEYENEIKASLNRLFDEQAVSSYNEKDVRTKAELHINYIGKDIQADVVSASLIDWLSKNPEASVQKLPSDEMIKAIFINSLKEARNSGKITESHFSKEIKEEMKASALRAAQEAQKQTLASKANNTPGQHVNKNNGAATPSTAEAHTSATPLRNHIQPDANQQSNTSSATLSSEPR